MPYPHVIHMPLAEAEGFEHRAKGAFPNEYEDWILGRSTARHVEVVHIVPTLPEHVVARSRDGITLRGAARNRANELAAELDLDVLGTVHTHPVRYLDPRYIRLSKTDCEVFKYEDIILGVLMVVPDRKSVGTYRSWWSFYQGNSPRPIRIKYV